MLRWRERCLPYHYADRQNSRKYKSTCIPSLASLYDVCIHGVDWQRNSDRYTYRTRLQKELKRKFCIDFRNGMICGAVLLMPLITACLFFGDFIASLYTSDPEIKLDIAKCLTASTPFLICEYIYIVTRSTLRSMLDFWIPTLMSIASLNFIGIGLIYSLIDTSPDPLLFIYYSLSFSSFILMLLLLWRFRAKYNQFSCNCAQRMRED